MRRNSFMIPALVAAALPFGAALAASEYEGNLFDTLQPHNYQQTTRGAEGPMRTEAVDHATLQQIDKRLGIFGSGFPKDSLPRGVSSGTDWPTISQNLGIFSSDLPK